MRASATIGASISTPGSSNAGRRRTSGRRSWTAPFAGRFPAVRAARSTCLPSSDACMETDAPRPSAPHRRRPLDPPEVSQGHRGLGPRLQLHRLQKNIGEAAVELTADDLREIENAAAKITVHGARYPEH